MPKIFISYAQDGKEIASELKASLESGGQHTVFLHASDNPQAEKSAETAIKACDLFVTLVTENSHDSKFAYSHFKFAENAQKAILPIKIDSGLPPHLLAYDSIELKGLDVTPVSREIELAVLTNLRQNDQRTLRAVMIAVAFVALVFIGYTFLFPEVQSWYILNFVPTATATPTNTAVPTRTPSPTPSPLPSFYPVEGGGELLFLRWMDEDGSNYEIFLLDLTTGEETQLTDNPAADTSASWSPDGSQIVFTSNRDGDLEIYTMNADGSDVRQLTDNDSDDYQPSWSPDASRIAFAAERNGFTYPDIYIMDADGSNEEQLTDTGEADYRPVWSPDGSQIAFNAVRDFTSGLYLIDPDGENERRLTGADVHVNSAPSWSPDGSQILFLVDALRVGNEIYLINADGTNQQGLTDISESSVSSPSWSSDGSQIIFSQGNSRNNMRDIYIMNADGSNIRPVTITSEDESNARWRPQNP